MEDGFRQRRIVLEVVHDSEQEEIAGLDDLPMDECCSSCGGKGRGRLSGESTWMCTVCNGSGFKDSSVALNQKLYSPFEIYAMDLRLKQMIRDKNNESND